MPIPLCHTYTSTPFVVKKHHTSILVADKVSAPAHPPPPSAIWNPQMHAPPLDHRRPPLGHASHVLASANESRGRGSCPWALAIGKPASALSCSAARGVPRLRGAGALIRLRNQSRSPSPLLTTAELGYILLTPSLQTFPLPFRRSLASASSFRSHRCFTCSAYPSSNCNPLQSAHLDVSENLM